MIRRSLLTCFSNGFVFLLVLATMARADVTGSLLGVIRDASSAVVPGAHIVATNTEPTSARMPIRTPPENTAFWLCL